MADKSLFGRLQRLFSTQVVIRRIGKGKTRAIDTQRLQSQGNIKDLVDCTAPAKIGKHTTINTTIHPID